jgi:hypothetical protein
MALDVIVAILYMIDIQINKACVDLELVIYDSCLIFSKEPIFQEMQPSNVCVDH